MESKDLSFEKELSRIEEINNLLSAGNISLNDSVALYEEAAEHLQNCRKLLDNAELKIATISKKLHDSQEN